MAEQQQDINQLLKVRREKLSALQEAGNDPFTITKYEQTHHSIEVKEIYNEHRIWSELAEKERKIVKTMALAESNDVKSIREALNISSNEMSVYRERLIQKGVLTSTGYGRLSFSLPRFDVFVRDTYDEYE